MRPWGVSEWTATGGKLNFTAALEPIAHGAASAPPWTAATFALNGDYGMIDDVEIDDSLLPDAVPISVYGGKWQLPSADRVKFIREDSAYELTTERGNPSALKLMYTAKTASFKGSFKLFGIKENGSSKKLTATVNGVMVDGTGYGSAYVKPYGAVPVTINGE